MFEDDEPDDWEEMEEEVAPEHLKRKWDEEEQVPPAPVICAACRKPVPYDAVTCLYCGATLYASGQGLLSSVMAWIKKIFSRLPRL